MSKVRVLRVIEYIGEYEDVQKQLGKSQLANNGQKTHNGVTMKSALVGDFPEMLLEEEKTIPSKRLKQNCGVCGSFFNPFAKPIVCCVCGTKIMYDK